VDPHDIGRTYDADVIRINSQSGKGGIGFVLEQNYGYNLPAKMREALGYKVKSVSDHSHKELSAGEVLHIFEDTFLNKFKPLAVIEAHFRTGQRHHRHRHAGHERPAQGHHLGGQWPSGCRGQRHPERHRYGVPSGNVFGAQP
jgi:hypothetical protein